MKSYHGIAVSAGVAISKALVFAEDSRPIPRYEVLPEEEEAQYERLLVAVRRSAEDSRPSRWRRRAHEEHEALVVRLPAMR